MLEPADTTSDTCMFCVKAFPIELKARMKAQAAAQRQSLRDFLIGTMNDAFLGTSAPAQPKAKRRR